VFPTNGSETAARSVGKNEKTARRCPATKTGRIRPLRRTGTDNDTFNRNRNYERTADHRPDLRFRRHARPRKHAGIRLHPRRRQEQQGVLARRQPTGRGAGRRHGADLHGPHDPGGAVERPVPATRSVPGVGPPRDPLQRSPGVVRTHQRLRRGAGHPHPALHQLLGPEGDHRRHGDRP
jgi:hypothetical protein